MKMISKALLLLLGFVPLAAAQSVDVTVTKGVVTFKNSGSQEIITLIATASAAPDPSIKSSMGGAKANGVYGHEWYFKPHGLVVGATEMWDTGNAMVDASGITIRFVQYVDGSTWGSGGESIIAQRPSVIAYLKGLNSTTSDADFVSAMNTTQPSGSLAEAKQTTLKEIYRQYGMAPARASVADSLKTASSRSF